LFTIDIDTFKADTKKESFSIAGVEGLTVSDLSVDNAKKVAIYGQDE